MALVEKIQHYLHQLPLTVQAEVLDFVEYLFRKAERQEEREWSEMALAFAMRGMEDEETPVYTLSDLKVVFS